jgi:AAA domain
MSDEAQLPNGSEDLPTKKPSAVVKPLMELQPAKENDGNTLLGNRFLCRGGGGLLIGPTGIGKSTAIIQMGICWSVGKECFSIAPAQPLKILYIQSENDEGDLCEMRDGVLEHLKLNPEKRERLDRNFTCVFESSRAGGDFIRETLEPLLQKHSPDLVILDPALAYIGGNASEQETVGTFLRNLLNPVLQTHKCGVLIVHHTPKPNGDGKAKNKLATDFAYAGLGSVEWSNCARFILVLSARQENGVRELRVAKRARLGWKDALGQPCFTRLLRQNPEGGALYYAELSPEEAMAMDGKLTPLQQFLRSGIFAVPGEEIAKDALIAKIAEKKICGLNTARRLVVELLISEGYVEEFEKPRSTGRPQKWLRRTQKEVGKLSFASHVAVTELVAGKLQTAPPAVCN